MRLFTPILSYEKGPFSTWRNEKVFLNHSSEFRGPHPQKTLSALNILKKYNMVIILSLSYIRVFKYKKDEEETEEEEKWLFVP